MSTNTTDWLTSADQQNLTIVEVTEGLNGYPKNLKKAVTGFDFFYEAEQFAKIYQKRTVLLSKRDGHEFWKYCRDAYEALQIDESWIGDNNVIFRTREEWWETEKNYLKDCILQEDTTADDFKEHIERILNIHNTFDYVFENQQVRMCMGNSYPEIIPMTAMRYHDSDVTDYAIAVY